MATLTKNLSSNFLGSFITTLIPILGVPLYIKYLGVESYGLIGFYVSLMSVFSFLDLGWVTNINQEMASILK